MIKFQRTVLNLKVGPLTLNSVAVTVDKLFLASGMLIDYKILKMANERVRKQYPVQNNIIIKLPLHSVEPTA